MSTLRQVFSSLHSVFASLSQRPGLRAEGRERLTPPAFYRVAIIGLLGGIVPVAAMAATATTTTLATSSSGGAYTLTATVKAGGTTLTLGQVNFCDATVTYCTDSHFLGSTQITSAGTATMVIRPGVVARSVKAVFTGTTAYTASTSSTVALPVLVAKLTPTIAITGNTGTSGVYGLTTTVNGASAQTTTPTGTVQLQDTSNNNYVLGSATLLAGTKGFGFAQTQSTIGGDFNLMGFFDFNHDGIPDLINYVSETSIQLGNGDGTYTYNTNYQTDPNFSNAVNQFYAFAVGDFNNDGQLDIAMVGSSILRVFLGSNGNGFTKLADIAIPSGSDYGMATGDFNGDGKLDLVFINYQASTYTVAFGNGAGAFALQTPVTTGGNTLPQGLVMADLNNDGKLDFVTQNVGASNIGVFLGNGDGTFTTKAGVVSGGGAYPENLALGDFNGDGKLDLAVPFANGAVLEVALGNGDGTFAAATTVDSGNTGYQAAVGDFNGDGKLDVAVTNGGGGTVDVYLGTGTGTFTLQGMYGVQTVQTLAVADINVDGRQDFLAMGNYYNVTAFTSETLTPASFFTTVTVYGNGVHNIQAVYAGDTNYNTTTSATVGLTAKLQATSTTLTAAPATSTYVGSQVVLTAVVAPTTTEGYANNGNTVTFMDGSTALGTGTTSSGVATFTTTSLGVGSHSLTAVFAGDGGVTFAGSTSAAINYLVKYPPVVTISGTQAVGTSSSPQTVTFLFSGSVTTATALATAIQVTSKGGVTSEFTYASGGSCLPAHAYTYGQSCTVNVVFTPLYPGLRQGGVSLVSSANQSIASVQLSGQATSSQGVFRATSGTAFATAVPSGSGTAVDGAGDVWVCNGTTVKEYSPTGTLLTTISGYSTTSAIALDGAGNVYVADTGTATISMAAAVGAVKTTVISVSNVTSIALDAAGNLYYSTAASVFELPAGATTATVLAPASNTRAIALDGAGNLFYTYATTLHEIAAGNGANTVVPTAPLTFGANYISGIAVDTGENIFLTDTGIGRIVELPNGGTPFVLMSGTNVLAPTVAPNGNLIYVDTTIGSARQLNRVAPTVTFPSTASGSSSAQQVVTVESIGTQALNLNALNISGPFNLNGAGTTCATPVQLNPGQTCGLGVIMAPVTGGTQTGTLVLTDDSLGGSASTQTATLTGTATQLAQTITFPQPANVATGTPITLTATATSGLTVVYTATAGTAIINGNVITPTSVGTLTIAANQPGNVPYAAAATVSRSITVTKGGQTITFPALPTSVTFGSAPLTLAATANSGLAITYVVTGPATVNGTTLSITGSGTITVTATQPGTANFNAATPVMQTITSTQPSSVPQYSSNLPVGSSGQIGVSVNFTTAFTIGNIVVTSQGAPGTPATLGSGSTCSAGGSVNPGDSCSIGMMYTSTGPGMVTAVVSIYDTAGNLQGASTIVIVQYH